MRIAVVTNLPSPYRIPLFNQLGEDLRRIHHGLTVVFLTRGYARRRWVIDEKALRFDHKYLEGFRILRGEGFISLGLGLLPLLCTLRPDVVVTGSFSFPMVWSWLYARVFGKRFVVWSGETSLQVVRRSSWFGMRRLIRSFFVYRADAGIAYGQDAALYLMSLGLSRQRIRIAINTVDTEYFSAETTRARERIPRELPDTVNLLYVGHLTKLKGIDCLFRAVAQLRDLRPQLRLHLVGDGNYRSELEEMSYRMPLPEISWYGFKQQAELVKFYANADVFVFPSLYDIWGLVCVEAASAGLPIVCSRYCGVATDLVRDGQNGFTIDPLNTDEFAQTLDRLIRNRELRVRLGAASANIVHRDFTLTRSAEGFMAAVDLATTDEP
jgi:glycosyltransferase involved in cell wall biosynthesis